MVGPSPLLVFQKNEIWEPLMHDRDRPRWLGIENSNQCLVIYRGGVDPVAGSGCGLGWLACYGIRRVILRV